MSLDIYFSELPKEPVEVFSKNITHNLGTMADHAGIYKCLWRPDENGITHVHQIIEPLKSAIADMEANPEKYKPLSASNGWGTYEQFLPWLRELLAACEEHPNAEIRVSR